MHRMGKGKVVVKVKNSDVCGTSPCIQTDNSYLFTFNNDMTSGINDPNWNLEDSSHF